MTADRAAQGASNRRKGDQHARNVVSYIRGRGFPNARRETMTYQSDIRGTDPLALECKYTTWQAIPAAVDQANRDAELRGLARGVVIKKRQGIEDVGQGFWIGTVATELAAAVRLIELEARVAELEALVTGAALQAPQPAPQARRRVTPAARRAPARVVPAVPEQAPVVLFKPPGMVRPAHPEGLPF